ncbi:antitoxin, partial [Kocuria flava]|uniref:antitoxin n=1 Tax=Kocuria flava TaxID=446860 RepID=UPI001FF40DC1
MDLKGLVNKAKDYARRNPDKVGKVIDRAGNLVDRRTGRKYERHVDSAQQKARDLLGGGPGTGPRPGDGEVERAPDAVVVTPSHQYPLGASMPA